MHVIDAEYQFDRHKLTFFFEADKRIDFRELVRDLFSVYVLPKFVRYPSLPA
jgi:cell fate regulator YaaT (PSP1 superfamily)